MIERKAGCLHVATPMVFSTATALLTAGQNALSEPSETFDLSGVKAADSTALAVMLGWMRAAEASGRTLKFTHLPVGVQALINLYGLHSIFA